MKPFEYKWYEPCDCHICGPRPGGLLINDDPHLAVGPKAIQQILDRKHLSDAECAAEYWRAVNTSNSTGEQLYPTYDDTHPLWSHHEQAAKEEATWERFATYPHAFGGDQ